MQTSNGQLFETTETPRIGRKSKFDEQTRRGVIMEWEQQRTTQPFSILVDFLVEKLGANADGSPKISPQTFYTWRKKLARKNVIS